VLVVMILGDNSCAEAIRIDSGYFNRSCFNDSTIAFLQMNYLTEKRSEIKKFLERKRAVGGFLMSFFIEGHIMEKEKGRKFDSSSTSKDEMDY
jgi:hypothetical protein